MMILFVWTMTSIYARVTEKSWWSPGALLALSMWISAFGTIIIAPEYYMSIEANFYLAAMIILASYGSVIGGLFGREDNVQPFVTELERPKFLFNFGMFFSIFSFVITLRTIGVGVSDLVSPLAIMRAAQAATYQRYTTGLSFPLYYNMSNALFLAYSMVVAIYFVERRKLVLRYMIPILIFVATNMLITTRAPILFMILLMTFSAVYAYHLRTGVDRLPRMFTPQVIKYILVGSLSVACVFFLFQVLRFGENSTRSSAEVWSHLRRWPWGSLPGFSVWFDGATGGIWDRVPGSFTWMGVFDLLGIEDRVVGAFGDYLYLTSTEAANIYTLFRGLYLDFGFIGSGVFMFVVGLIGGLSVWLIRKVGPYIAMSVYVGVMCLFAYAFVISFWAYTANIIALVCMPFLASYCFGASDESATDSSQRSLT
jgi:oligosaccharide repeat unit polymerase